MPIGIDIGGTTMRLGRVELEPEPEVVDLVSLATPADIGAVPELLIGELDRFGVDDAIGIGCAGIVDRESGTWRWVPHAAGVDVEISGPLRRRYGVGIALDNDANMAVLAEARRGAGAGDRLVLLVQIGTGIGGGVALDGEVERGRGSLGEIGHMRVHDQPECSCGAQGCWEALVSGRVLDRAARRLLGPDASAVDLPEDAAALDEAGDWLGVGLANLLMVLAPDVVVLGGGVTPIIERLLRPARARLEAHPGGLRRAGIPPIRIARFGAVAGLIGAAMAAQEITR